MAPTLAWLALAAGLLLGLLPPRFFYNKSSRHLTLLEIRSSQVHHSSTLATGRRRRAWWKSPLVWLDPFRGYGSAHLLNIGLLNVIPPSYAAGPLLLKACHFGASIAILFIQITKGRQKPGQLLAPVCFLFGFTTGVYLDFAIVGASVAALAVATMFGTHSFMLGYVTAGAAAVGIGFPFLGPGPALGVFAIVASAPLYLAFMQRATLVLPVRG
jgi:hypothetical protein